jgi:glyoxylase-like metal-dependent hydrolase (beta-lactamase superfamily II)
VLVTHGHPDHYGGIAPLTEGAPVPVYAIAGVDRVIRRDDGEKELIMRPLFGDEWATARRFPDHIVGDGERVTIGGASFRVIDTGPGESRHDSWWMLEGDGPPRVFPGDLVYNHMHAYLADGFHEAWLSNIGRAKRELPKDVRLYPGHGEPASGHGLLDWQVQYIDRLLETLRSAVERDGLEGEPLAEAVMAKMKAFLATDDLLFLARLSVEPLRHQLTLGAKP